MRVALLGGHADLHLLRQLAWSNVLRGNGTEKPRAHALTPPRPDHVVFLSAAQATNLRLMANEPLVSAAVEEHYRRRRPELRFRHVR